MSQNALVFDLSMPNKDLKYITVNMLSKNLKLIDLQNNRIEYLPEEIADLKYLEKLKVDSNNLKCLPALLYQL
jgi:Leucine-rich repeat (LRR) protein